MTTPRQNLSTFVVATIGKAVVFSAMSYFIWKIGNRGSEEGSSSDGDKSRKTPIFLSTSDEPDPILERRLKAEDEVFLRGTEAGSWGESGEATATESPETGVPGEPVVEAMGELT